MTGPSNAPTSENEVLRAKLAEAENKLAEAQEVLRAIQSGDVDAVVVCGPEGDQVFTLRGAEYAYRALVEAMNEGAATLGPDGTVLYCNHCFSALLGLPLEQIIGAPVGRLVTAEAKPLFEALFVQARDGEPAKAELEFQAADGRRIPTQVSLREMRSTEPAALCMVVTDLTERHQRDELIAAGRLAASILASAAEAIAVCDKHGRIIRVNEAMEELCGFNPMLQPFDVAMPLEVTGQGAASGEHFSISETLRGRTLRAQEASFRRRDGRDVALLLTAAPIPAASGVAGCVLNLTDITERKRVQDAVRGQADLLRLSFDAVIVWRLRGGIESWNRGAEQLYGYAEGEALGRVTHELLKTVHPSPWLDIEATLAETGRWHGDLHHSTKDGREVVVSARKQLFRGADGIERVLEINRDITDRKRAEEELRRSQEWLRVTLTSIGDAVLATDVEGKVRFLNPVAAALTGWQPEEAQGRPSNTVLRIINEQTRVPAEDIIARVLRDKQSIELANHTALLTKDGREIPIEDSAAPIFDVDGNIVGVVLVFHDVTAKRRAEEERQAGAERFRALVTASSNVLYRMSPDWREMRQLDGRGFLVDTDEPNRTWLQEYIHQDDWPRVMAAINEAIRTKSVFELEHRVRRADGSLGWTFSRAVPLKDAEGEIVEWFGAASDISERKQAGEALLRAEKLASVGRMAATIAHEINNPLETIGHAVYLATNAPGASAEVKSFLDLAAQELERVTQITRQTLAFNRESKAPVLIDLRECVDSILKLFAARLKARGITVDKRYAEVEPIRAAGGEIQQVIANLLSNSMDAMPNHGKIHCRVSGAAGDNGSRRIRFTIADTGSGIHRERMKKIFEPFFTTKEMVGTGLGLWVTKQILEKHGASIRVRSKLGSGTVFSIAFPVAAEQPR